MASFIVTGVANDPDTAKAEALAYFFQSNLPNYRVKVILKGAEEWVEHVDKLTKKFNWKLSKTQASSKNLIYRVTGPLIGTTAEFITHMNHCYGSYSELLDLDNDQKFLEIIANPSTIVE